MPEEMIFMETFFETLKREISKNIGKRIETALLVGIPIIVLFDEWAKEGYAFKISDIFQTAYISHEHIIITSVIIGFFVRCYNDSIRPKAKN